MSPAQRRAVDEDFRNQSKGIDSVCISCWFLGSGIGAGIKVAVVFGAVKIAAKDAAEVGVKAATEKLADGLSPEVKSLSEAHLTNSGDTVLGSYPSYIGKANARGASYFDIENKWNALRSSERAAANNHFLDIISARGDRVLLSTPKSKIRAGTQLSNEVKYLQTQKVYRWINQWSLRSGGG
jgi:hypothetical protein